VGSSWLLDSLRGFPGVRAYGEMRWLMPYQALMPEMHFYLGGIDNPLWDDMAPRLSGIALRVMKLKFDPYGFILPSYFEQIANEVDPTAIVSLRRCYFDIWQTWKLYGIRHLADRSQEEAAIRDADRDEKEALERFFAMFSDPLERLELMIDTGDGPGEISPDVTRYPIRDIVDDMLVFFYNDYMISKYVLPITKSLVIAYEDIADEFERLALFLGIMPSSRMSEKPLRSLLKRMEPKGEPLLEPSAGLYALSSYLQRRLAVAEAADFADDTVSCRGDRIEFRLPGIADLLSRFPETSRLQELVDGETWRAARSIYVPVMKATSLLSAAE
jgi:hypothetical protein